MGSVSKHAGGPEMGKPGSTSWGGAVVLFAVTVLGGPSLGCDDPYALEWFEVPDTALLYTMARPELNLASAFDFLGGIGMVVESAAATGNWDVVLDTQEGRLVLSPPGVFHIESEARISVFANTDFWDMERAPGDSTLYVTDAPVPLEMGSVYVIRTREITDYYGNTCIYHLKMEPLVLDPEKETLTFRYLLNPNCNSLRLVP